MKTRLFWIILVLISLLLSGCSSFDKPEQPHRSFFFPLTQDSSIGQTFVARYDGLHALTVYLKPGTNSTGALVLNLRSDPDLEQNIAITTLPLENITTEGYYQLKFPPLDDSNRKDYYALLKIRGPGDVQVGASQDTNHYLNGSLYNHHTPLSAQLNFQLTYSSRWAVIGLIKEILTWLGWLIICFFLFVIPGWALLNRLWSGWSELHWAEKIGLAGGLSLAIYPLMILWTSLTGLKIGVFYAWVPPTLGSIMLVWGYRNRFQTLPSRIRNDFVVMLSNPTILWSELTLLAVIALVFLTRFWAVRDLDIPMWGDSYQHTMIAQLIVDNKGLFDSWQPYAQLTTFTYHFGFHSAVAVFHWITDLPLHKSVLWIGQILNGMVVIFLFALVMRIKRNIWGGIFALIFAGLLIRMPMSYVNWGRYTQLAGQAILPATILFAWSVLDSERPAWQKFALAWIALGGLAITHYRVLLFAFFFFPVYILLNFKIHGIKQPISAALIIGLGALILTLPWFLHVFAGKLPAITATIVADTATSISSSAQAFVPFQDLSRFLPISIWLIVLIVIGWRLWQHDRSIAMVCLWWLLIFMAANLHLFKIPGTGILDNFTVLIAVYIPASLILGSACGYLFDSISPASHRLICPTEAKNRNSTFRWYLAALFLIIAVLGIKGARDRLWDIDPTKHALATRPDLRAFNWIQEHTPNNARFLVNSFFAYNGAAIVGSDGGWWLPLLASRLTNLPPLNYSMEQGPFPNYAAWINQLITSINQKGINDPDVVSMLRERDITHVYIGQRQGAVNSAGPLLNLDDLVASPNFQPVYHQDNVWIFKIND